MSKLLNSLRSTVGSGFLDFHVAYTHHYTIFTRRERSLCVGSARWYKVFVYNQVKGLYVFSAAFPESRCYPYE